MFPVCAFLFSTRVLREYTVDILFSTVVSLYVCYAFSVLIHLSELCQCAADSQDGALIIIAVEPCAMVVAWRILLIRTFNGHLRIRIHERLVLGHG